MDIFPPHLMTEADRARTHEAVRCARCHRMLDDTTPECPADLDTDCPHHETWLRDAQLEREANANYETDAEATMHMVGGAVVFAVQAVFWLCAGIAVGKWVL